MELFDHLARTDVHVDAAGEARVEAADCPHDVDPFEILGTVLLEDRGVLHGIFIRPWRAVNIAWVGIPRSRRIGVVVGNLALANHYVVRENAADRLVEAAAD